LTSVLIAFVVFFFLLLLLGYFRSRKQSVPIREIQELVDGIQLHLQKFLASKTLANLPRGVAWSEIRFQGSIDFYKRISPSQLFAIVAVQVYFSPIDGGEFEGHALIHEPREGFLRFFYSTSDRDWICDGKLLLNMNRELLTAEIAKSNSLILSLSG
jgi:hypothetical protein